MSSLEPAETEMEASPKVRDGVFISHRWSDAKGEVQALCERLWPVFGRERVFVDHVNVKTGEGIGERIEEGLAQAKVVLAVVGPTWFTTADEWGERRIDDQKDWVRHELRTAFAKGLTVIPVLVKGRRIAPARKSGLLAPDRRGGWLSSQFSLPDLGR